MTKPKTPQHPDDAAVDKFARAMKRKLAQARERGRHGWNEDDCSTDYLAACFMDEVTCDRPDPRDIANYAMFLYLRRGGRAALREVSNELMKELE
jgi:hypothetical protein